MVFVLQKVLRLQSRLKELEAVAAPKQHIYFVDSKSKSKKKEKKKASSVGNVVDDLVSTITYDAFVVYLYPYIGSFIHFLPFGKTRIIPS